MCQDAAVPPSSILDAPDLSALPAERLEDMHDAAATVLQCEAALAKSGMSVVSEVLRGQGDFLVWERYPRGDVFDTETHSQYFYHAHAPEEMAKGENGHFHLFVRPAGLAPDLRPWALDGAVVADDPAARFIHIGAISVDAHGQPIRLFTTNRWVTNETLFAARDVIPLLDRFTIGVAHPNWAVSQWLTSMVRLYHPQFAGLLRLRDAVLRDRAARQPGTAVSEDRTLQNTSEFRLDRAAQIAAIEEALGI